MKVHTEQAVMVISRVDWERGGERGKDVDKGGLWLMSMTSMCLSIKGKPHSLVFICRTKEGQRLGGGGGTTHDGPGFPVPCGTLLSRPFLWDRRMEGLKVHDCLSHGCLISSCQCHTHPVANVT